MCDVGMSAGLSGRASLSKIEPNAGRWVLIVEQ